MYARLRRALVLALLCILSVQGMAATLVPMACVPHSAHSEHGSTPHTGDEGTTVTNDVEEHHDALAGDVDPRKSDDSTHASLCCHQFASATPPAQAYAARPDMPVYAAAVTFHAPLHIPELPQRPPRH